MSRNNSPACYVYICKIRLLLTPLVLSSVQQFPVSASMAAAMRGRGRLRGEGGKNLGAIIMVSRENGDMKQLLVFCFYFFIISSFFSELPEGRGQRETIRWQLREEDEKKLISAWLRHY